MENEKEHLDEDQSSIQIEPTEESSIADQAVDFTQEKIVDTFLPKRPVSVKPITTGTGAAGSTGTTAAGSTGTAAARAGGAVAKVAATGGTAGTTAAVAGGTAAVAGTTAAVAGTTAAVAGTTAAVAGTTAAAAGTTAAAAGTTAAVAGGTAAAAGTTAAAAGTTAAVAGGTAVINPLAAVAVAALLSTKTGRKTLKVILFSVVAAAIIVVLFILSIASSVTAFSNIFSSSSAGVIGENGGGLPITDPAQKAEAVEIIKQSQLAGLNPDAALAGLVAALAASDLRMITPSAPNPLSKIGVFGLAPFEWAPQFWSGVKYGTPEFYEKDRLDQAIAFLEETENSAKLFFASFNVQSELKNGQWLERSSWEVAKLARESRNGDYSNLEQPLPITEESSPASGAAAPEELLVEGSDESSGWNNNEYSTATYAAQGPRAISSISTLFYENPSWLQDSPEFWRGFKFNKINQGLFFGIGAFSLAPAEERVFFDGPVVYPKTNLAIERAMLFVGNAQLACGDGRCYRLCDHLAGDIWGYWDYSGYRDAKYHWAVAVSQGIARPSGRVPPIGALLFWDSGPQGHVATYVGNGMVVSNLSNGGANGANVYLVPAEYFENNWGSPYLGWADPVFRGQKPGSALPCALPASYSSGC